MKTIHLIIMMAFFIAVLSCKKEDAPEAYEPAGWFIAGSTPQEYKIGVDDLDAQQGEQSGFIESVVDTITGFGTLMQSCNGENFKGQRVRMTAYIQNYGPETTVTLMWLRVDDYAKHVTADFDNMDDRPIMGTHYWAQYEIVFDVPDTTCVLNYGVILLGTGKVWIDNISFEINNDLTYKTAYYLNDPFPAVWQFPQDLPENPVNLDFEE